MEARIVTLLSSYFHHLTQYLAWDTHSIKYQIFKYIKTKQKEVLYYFFLIWDVLVILTSAEMKRLDFTVFYKPKGHQEKY